MKDIRTARGVVWTKGRTAWLRWAQALKLEKGEEIEWVVDDKATLATRRRKANVGPSTGSGKNSRGSG